MSVLCPTCAATVEVGATACPECGSRIGRSPAGAGAGRGSGVTDEAKKRRLLIFGVVFAVDTLVVAGVVIYFLMR